MNGEVHGNGGPDRPPADTTTIILVHGALSDASIWANVIARLRPSGLRAVAPAMPLRGLHSDAAYLAAFLDTFDGPKVLVAHSYAGSVISHPSIDRPDVNALVFAAAFMPDAGETTGALNGRWPGSRLSEQTIEARPYPGGVDIYLKPDAFAEVYASDIPADLTATMAAAQRPIDAEALGQAFDGVPSWRRRPSWALISTEDKSLPVEGQRFMAARAGSTSSEVAASHASPVSQPDELTRLIVEAAQVGDR